MRNFITRLVPSPWLARKFAVAACVAGIAIGAFFWGRQVAQSQTKNGPARSYVDLTPASASGGEYSRRVVAYIHGNVPITREDLGEYLIARNGPERVEALVNRRILDLACRAQNIYVTDAEVQAQLNAELKSLGTGITERDFASQILKRFNKSLFEWKEDVIRPRLALTKMVESTITVAPEDLQKAFEARYGAKVKCRMIVLAKENKNHWGQVWEQARKNEDGFREVARSQSIPALASSGGEVPPIHKHFGDANLEKEAFSLKPGEVSRVVEMSDGTGVILKCDGQVPEDPNVRLDTERSALHREIVQFKLNQRIPEKFKELRAQADPKIYLTNQIRQDDLERHALKELNPRAASTTPPAASGPVDPSKLEAPPPGTYGNSSAPTSLVTPPTSSGTGLPSSGTGLPSLKRPQGN